MNITMCNILIHFQTLLCLGNLLLVMPTHLTPSGGAVAQVMLTVYLGERYKCIFMYKGGREREREREGESKRKGGGRERETIVQVCFIIGCVYTMYVWIRFSIST